MLMPLAASVSNIFAATPGCERMPMPTTDSLAMSASRGDFAGADFLDDGLQDFCGLRGFVGGDGEGNVGEPFFADVLDDDVDVDVGVGDRLEHLRGDAGFVGHAGDGDFGLVLVNRDAADDDVFHFCGFFFHDGSWVVVKTAAHFKHDTKLLGKLDGTSLHHLRAKRRQFQHLVVADFREFARVGHEARVGSVHAVHVRVNLAQIGLDGGGDGNRGQIAAAASERGDLAVGRLPWKPAMVTMLPSSRNSWTRFGVMLAILALV